MKRESTKIKEAMGKNTSLVISGRRTWKKYMAVDDKLHDRLKKVLKKKR